MYFLNLLTNIFETAISKHVKDEVDQIYQFGFSIIFYYFQPYYSFFSYSTDGGSPGSGKDDGDRSRWEEEQRNLDRAWYDLDAGYDEYTNPFAQVSEEYVKKKEEKLKQQKQKRKSARARQAQKVI